jgi:hypothetical protein
LSDGFHNKRLKESSEAWKRDLALNLALHTKTRHGREIREANTCIGLLRARWVRVLSMMEVEVGVRVGVMVRMRLWRRFKV